jgi:hypothetical protein
MAELKLDFDHFFEPILDKAVIRNNISFQSGIYFWFVNEASLNRLKIPMSSNLYWIYKNNQNFYLIYIGIGPSNQNVRRQFLKDRITKCHLGKYINQSTLRQSISALLEHKPYNKMVGQNMKIFIEPDLESEITDFIINGLSIGVLKHDEPWTIEGEFIQNYNPPINLRGNQNGWFFNEMSLKRANHRAIGAEDIRVK